VWLGRSGFSHAANAIMLSIDVGFKWLESVGLVATEINNLFESCNKNPCILNKIEKFDVSSENTGVDKTIEKRSMYEIKDLNASLCPFKAHLTTKKNVIKFALNRKPLIKMEKPNMRVDLTRVGLPFVDAPHAPKKKDLAAALKAAGLPQSPNLDPLHKAVMDMRRIRRERHEARSVKVTPLAEKLDTTRRTEVVRTAARTFRHGAAGGHSLEVTLTTDPRIVGYVVNMGRNWTTYAGAYKGWGAIEDHHRITVPVDWRMRVQRRGLAELDGLMTLDAIPLDGAPVGIQLFSAVWASQGRGYDVRTHRGVIAVSVDRQHSFRGATAQAAVAGVERRMRVATTLTGLSAIAHLSDDQFVARIIRYDTKGRRD
jgi:hypothetical protein